MHSHQLVLCNCSVKLVMLVSDSLMLLSLLIKFETDKIVACVWIIHIMRDLKAELDWTADKQL